jgi:hypothetical protein
MEAWAKLLLTKPHGLETLVFGTVVVFRFFSRPEQVFFTFTKDSS